jgi:hypothetical protein
LSTVLVFKPSIDLNQSVEGGAKINGVAEKPVNGFLPWHLEIDSGV